MLSSKEAAAERRREEKERRKEVPSRWKIWTWTRVITISSRIRSRTIVMTRTTRKAEPKIREKERKSKR